MGSQNVIDDSIRQFRVYRIGLVDRIPWGVTAYACKPGYASVSVKLYFTDEDSGTIQLVDSDSQGVRILNPPPTPTPTQHTGAYCNPYAQTTSANGPA